MVRTSIAEADRRTEPRFRVVEACAVEAGGQRMEGRLAHISAHGALVSGVAGLPTGSWGVLHMPRHGVRIEFEVRGTSQYGLHMRFPDSAVTDAYRRAFELLSGTAYPRAAA